MTGTEQVAIDFARQHGRKVGQIMTPNPITISEGTRLEQIVRLMEARDIKRLPVMRGDEIVGMVTRTDFLGAVAAFSRDLPGYSRPDEDIRRSVVAAMSDVPWRPCGLNVSVDEGEVTLRGVIKSDSAPRAVIVAAENIPGVKRVEDIMSKLVPPLPEEDYGGGDFVSLQEEPSTADDEPL